MLEIRPLPKSLAQRAQKILNEKPDEIEGHVKHLRKWILSEPHLKARTDDQFLVSFLRCSKYDMNVAKQKIDLFFTMRQLMPEITRNRDIRNGTNAEILKLGTSIPLPLTHGEDGPRIFLLRPGRYDPNLHDITDIFKTYIMFTDLLLIQDDHSIIGGLSGILDLTNVTPDHLKQFKPDFLKKMTLFSQEASPFQPRGFHYVNTPQGFEYVFNLFKGFMSKEYKTQLYVHGDNMESLYRYVPKRFLPTEYGGEAGTIQSLIDHWVQKLSDSNEQIVEWDKYGTDETKRKSSPITEETILSIPNGTFDELLKF